ncbi:MAG: hypothetical protein MI806_11195 [Minwuiales bacterium]|nr:hypothetical protein [Minwuiales bacterium]
MTPDLPSMFELPFRTAFTVAAAIGAAAVLLAGSPEPARAGPPKVITFTQVACQILEAENGVNHNFETTRRADCERINAQTRTKRLAEARPIRLKPGSYIFRVTNMDVPYELGFWLRDKDYDWRNPIHKLTKVAVLGGGLMSGQTRDYIVELKPGRYIYSCPLNTTPDYELIVAE